MTRQHEFTSTTPAGDRWSYIVLSDTGWRHRYESNQRGPARCARVLRQKPSFCRWCVLVAHFQCFELKIKTTPITNLDRLIPEHQRNNIYFFIKWKTRSLAQSDIITHRDRSANLPNYNLIAHTYIASVQEQKIIIRCTIWISPFQSN